MHNKNYDLYISRNIKTVYKRKLIIPLTYSIILMFLWMVFPFSDIILPKKMTKYSQIEHHFQEGNTYIQADIMDLYFTGYTSTRFGKTTGYYYYTVWDDTCLIVLLSPSTSEEGLPLVKNINIRASIVRQGKGYDQLLDKLADDLSWTFDGIESRVSDFILSEPDFRSGFSTLLLIVYFTTGAFTLFVLFTYLLYILSPVFSPPCRRLGRYGKPSELLAQAEEELATLLQLTTEDMFITEHFFIVITDAGIAIVPIQEIVWIYKHSTLHKFFWYHFSISYTLHITANKHLQIHCPRNIKSDIDGIIDYLSEANHSILVGFSEDNRAKIQEVQNPAIKFEKLIAFFKQL